MKKSRFTDQQIAFALQQAETGTHPGAAEVGKLSIAESDGREAPALQSPCYTARVYRRRVATATHSTVHVASEYQGLVHLYGD
jgi:hypothetical protein